MAEAFAAHLGKGLIHPESAGSRPAHAVNPDAIRVMKEKGIDLSGRKPKSVEEASRKSYDYVVTMGCGDICPVVPTQAVVSWDIPDPKGKSFSVFREVRDLIEEKVKGLLKEIQSFQEC